MIGSLKHKIDEFMSQQHDAENEIKQAKWFLIERETRLFNARKKAIEGTSNTTSPTASAINNTYMNVMHDPFRRDEPKRKSITSSISSMFRRVSQQVGSASSISEPSAPMSSATSATSGLSFLNNSKEEDEDRLDSIHSNSSGSQNNSGHYIWYKDKSELKQYALCAVILEEWLKELAAISQEHTIAQLTTAVN